MDLITRDTLTSLISNERGPCVSAYMPTHRRGPETQQNPIRLKNSIDQAYTGLTEAGMRTADADAFLAPARRLMDDHDFWQHQGDGLALFISPERSEAHRVQVPFNDSVVVAPTFRIRPLVHAMSRDERFHVLALSENDVRLLWGTRFRVDEVDLPESVPGGLAEALWFNDPERQLQFRSAAGNFGGRRTAVFHGHGMGEQASREHLRQFLRAVDGGLTHLLDPAEPVVLAGVERLLDEFRAVSGHDALLDGAITGNPEHMTDTELHDGAWAIVEPHFAAERTTQIERIRGGGGVTGLDDTMTAVLAGRVATLFVDDTTEVWGRLGDDGRIERHDCRQDGDRELFDSVASATMERGGDVWVVDEDELPGAHAIAAITRY